MISSKPLKVAFCGTPDFCLPTLEMLLYHPSVSLTAVVSQPSRPVGRGYVVRPPPVVEFAQRSSLTIYQTENINQESELLDHLQREQVDLIIVLAFAQFLSQKILDLPRLGCFNIHTSLLPKYRGAAPIQHALLNGDSETGVSIQKMVKKMDAGDLVHWDKVAISPQETGGQLLTRLKFQAALSLNAFLEKVLNGNLHYFPQDESGVSFAPTLKKEDGLIHFELSDRQTVLNKIRALHPWPGTYCFLNQKRLKILQALSVEQKIPPGKVDTTFGQLVVGCQDGALRLTQIQLEGKKACSDIEFLRGMRETLNINS